MKIVKLGAVLVLIVPLLAACVQGNVIKNTNPGGKPGVECFLTIHQANGKDKVIQQDNTACLRCPVGANFPECKDERTPEPGVRRTVSGTPTKNEEMFTVTVVTTSTSKHFQVVGLVRDKRGEVHQFVAHTEHTAYDYEFRRLMVSSDRSIEVVVRAPERSAIVGCTIYGPARQDWGVSVTSSGEARCIAKIADKLKLPRI